VLGERSGFDDTSALKSDKPAPKKGGKKVVSLEEARDERQAQEQTVASVPSHLRHPLKDLLKYDPDFTLEDFAEGAQEAFTMIIKAFAEGDLKTLETLMSPDLYEAFAEAVNERMSQGYIMENTLVRFAQADVVSLEVSKDKASTARITMEFVTEQIPIMRDSQGNITEGNPDQIDQIEDTWVFERILTSDDPNWLLVQTEV
jgi:predicted lipid-binding transport protein (Tim44 family)